MQNQNESNDLKQHASLPENAFRELKEGESYEPLMPANQTPREVNVWSVSWAL